MPKCWPKKIHPPRKEHGRVLSRRGWRSRHLGLRRRQRGLEGEGAWPALAKDSLGPCRAVCSTYSDAGFSQLPPFSLLLLQMGRVGTAASLTSGEGGEEAHA